MTLHFYFGGLAGTVAKQQSRKQVFLLNARPHEGYVDRGPRSIDVMVMLFIRKIEYSQELVLLRGRDEDVSLSRIYGFYDECQRRFNIKLWKTFMDVFNCMPLDRLVELHLFPPTTKTCMLRSTTVVLP